MQTGPAAERRESGAFHKAHRHSGRVRFLKLALPVAAIIIVLAVAGTYALSGLGAGGDISIASAGFRDGRMVMKNPELNGVDANQRPFNLSALEAIQDPAAPGRIELSRIDATLPMEDGAFARIVAGNGLYNAGAKTLALGDMVDVETDSGMSIRLEDAQIDMDKGALHTENPVTMKTRQASISADGLSVEENGERIVFENRVRMTIYPASGDQTSQ